MKSRRAFLTRSHRPDAAPLPTVTIEASPTVDVEHQVDVPPPTFSLAQAPPFEPLAVDRSNAFVGVLIDDLTENGTSEPYRMFTARSEYRLSIRSDNSDMRLTEKGAAAGVVSRERLAFTRAKKGAFVTGQEILKSIVLTPTQWNSIGIQVRLDGVPRSAHDILRHNDVTLERLYEIFAQPIPNADTMTKDVAQRLNQIDPIVHAAIQIDAQYGPELARQNHEIERVRKQSHHPLPPTMDWLSLPSLSAEEKEKLRLAQPTTIGALWKIPGITPAAVMAIVTHLKNMNRPKRLSTEEYDAMRAQLKATRGGTVANQVEQNQ